MATPVLSYGFGIIDWPQIEIDNLDVKTRKILQIHKVLYRHQCMNRVYLPRREGGMGLIEINDAYRNTIFNLNYYLKTIQDGHLQKVRKQHEEDLPENKSITKLANIFNAAHDQHNNESATQVQDEESHLKYPYLHHKRESKKKRWQTNKRAGNFYEETQKSYIDQKGSFQWIQNGELKYDEERLLFAAQDQGLMTNGFMKM